MDRARGALRVNALAGLMVAALVAALVAGMTGGSAYAGSARQEVARGPAPVLHAGGFADPTVARFAHGFVAVSTGTRAPRAVAATPRGPWRPAGRALAELPGWARPAAIWASDLVRTRQGWLLYYSAVAKGGTRRCIGVAAARRVLEPFRPVGRRPLVCPPRGAIDPSGYVARRGSRHLLYKTQGLPTAIRMVRLSRDGRHRARNAAAHVLLRSRHTVVENPALVRRGRHLVLFTSEGSFEDCGYRTTWRRSRTLGHWGPPHLLLDTRGGLCGPGGADLSLGRQGRLVFFHGWACRGRRPCPSWFDVGRAGHRASARRALYAARLAWRDGPRIGRFVRPLRG